MQRVHDLFRRQTALHIRLVPHNLRQRLINLTLALLLLPNVHLDRARQLHKLNAMRRVPDLALLLAHDLQTAHVQSQIFSHAEPMPEHIVPGKESILFLEQETHVVFRVPGCKYCADRRAFCLEDLAVFDRELAGAWLILVYA